MMLEFQVFYEQVARPLSPAAGGGIQTILVRAETVNEARVLVEASGSRVISIGPGRPLVDWSQDTWDSEEACLFLKCKSSKLHELMGTGVLPKAKTGRPLFKKSWLERALLSRMDTREVPSTP